MLGYVIFAAVLAIFVHQGYLLYAFNKDMSLYGRLRGFNKWLLGLSTFLYWLVSVLAGFGTAFICKTLGVVGIFVGIAVFVVALKDFAVVIKAAKA